MNTLVTLALGIGLVSLISKQHLYVIFEVNIHKITAAVTHLNVIKLKSNSNVVVFQTK